MMKGVFVTLVGVGCPLIWIMIIVPIIAKCFGVPYKMGVLPFDKKQRLGRWQSFWFAGVLGWGICVFLVGAVIQILGDVGRKPTISALWLELVWGAFLGGLLSLWNYPRHSSRPDVAHRKI
jgi:small-conductance mechanosensitive channel